MTAQGRFGQFAKTSADGWFLREADGRSRRYGYRESLQVLDKALVDDRRQQLVGVVLRP
jgi:hypothetical protein